MEDTVNPNEFQTNIDFKLPPLPPQPTLPPLPPQQFQPQTSQYVSEPILTSKKNNLAILIIILIIILLLAIGGVGYLYLINSSKNKTNSTIQSTNTSNSIQSSPAQTVSQNSPTSQKASYLIGSFTNSTYLFQIDTPQYQSWYESPSQIWNVDGKYFIIIGIYRDTWSKYNIDKTQIKTVEDIPTALKQPIFGSSSRTGCTKLKDLIIDSKETVNINGFNMFRFTGSLVPDPTTDPTIANKYIVGYSLFYKNEPMYIIGVVSSLKQEQEYKDTITKNIDDMVKTFRNAD
jgi:hypothetical protein